MDYLLSSPSSGQLRASSGFFSFKVKTAVWKAISAGGGSPPPSPRLNHAAAFATSPVLFPLGRFFVYVSGISARLSLGQFFIDSIM